MTTIKVKFSQQRNVKRLICSQITKSYFTNLKYWSKNLVQILPKL